MIKARCMFKTSLFVWPQKVFFYSFRVCSVSRLIKIRKTYRLACNFRISSTINVRAFSDRWISQRNNNNTTRQCLVTALRRDKWGPELFVGFCVRIENIAHYKTRKNIKLLCLRPPPPPVKKFGDRRYNF